MEIAYTVMVQYSLLRTCPTLRAPRHVHLLCTGDRAANVADCKSVKSWVRVPPCAPNLSLWYNGITSVSKTADRGSIPWRFATQHGLVLCKPSCTTRFSFRPLVKWISSLSSKQWVEVRFLHGRPVLPKSVTYQRS